MRWLAAVACLQVAAAFQLLQLSDFHMDKDYDTHGDPQKMCHNVSGRSAPSALGDYGDYMCDSPKALVKLALKEAARIVPNPDMIIWTGDNTPHIEGYDMDYVYDAVQRTSNMLFSRFNCSHILPTFGNHDYAPANAFSNGSVLYKRVYSIWKKHIGEDKENEATFLLGGYYKYELENATVLVLNTNIYYNSNHAYDNFTDKADPAGQFAFMERELEKAERCRNSLVPCTSNVHIVAHIGPGAFERTPKWVWMRDEYNARLVNITRRYASTIKWALFGHHHTDTWHVLKDTNGVPAQLMLMSPSVTPWFSSLDGAGSNNPAFRVYDVDQITWNFKDIHTYSIDLRSLNKNATAQFSREYSFKSAYGIKGEWVDETTMGQVLEKMKTDDALFQQYITYNSVGWGVGGLPPALPQGQFRAGQLCSMEFVDFAEYYACLDKMSPPSSSTTVAPTTSPSPSVSLLAPLIACFAIFFL